MPSRNSTGEQELEFLARLARPTGRRQFLQWAGVSIAVTAVGCSDSSKGVTGPITTGPSGSHLTPPPPGTTVNLGTGDLGVLNYAFALEQLEAEFYTQVVNGPYFQSLAADSMERRVYDDVRAHEVVHREYLYAVLNANNANIPGLEFNFTSVDFSSGSSILQTAITFEDLGVSAYNGAAQLLQTGAFVAVAGKIVSVEARHAACFRDLAQPRTGFFAGDDIINTQGLDVVRVPAMVLPIVDPLIVTEVDASGLPMPQYVPASPTATVSA